MNPTSRVRAVADYCKGCIYDSTAAGTWREQVAACPVTGCALWPVRPLPKSPPAWITSHDPADLPDGWVTLDQADVVRRIRAAIAAGMPKQDHKRPHSIRVMVTHGSDMP